MQRYEVPPPLRRHDLVQVVAPSGPFDADRLAHGLARLGELCLRVPAGLSARRAGFLAGDDTARRNELQAAINDPEVRAIWVARGGYGLSRVVDQLDLSPLQVQPKWFCGFSDATVLHLHLLRSGVMSLHGPNLTTLVDTPTLDIVNTVNLLQGIPPSSLTELSCWIPGVARGPLVGGNLTVLFCEQAAGTLALPPGSVLFLEDVTETSYRIDRMLSSLQRAGVFERLSGIVLGEFTDCSPGKFGVPVEDVLREHFAKLGLPCVAGFPAGHGSRQHPFIHGSECTLDASAGCLRFDKE